MILLMRKWNVLHLNISFKITLRYEKKKHESFIPQHYVQPPPESEDERPDYLFNYHSAKLTFGLILADINDAIREGDGDRLLQLYKMALRIYYSHGRTKYQYTTLLLLVKTETLLSKLQTSRLTWNRFCNTKGRKGHSISLDLRLEQLNNLLKSFLKVLGSNLSLSSAQRVACCLDVLEAILESTDTDCSMHKDNKQRQCKYKAENVLQIVKDRVNKKVFIKTPGRKGYNSFPKISHNIISKLDNRDFYAWIKDKLNIWEKMYENN